MRFNKSVDNSIFKKRAFRSKSCIVILSPSKYRSINTRGPTSSDWNGRGQLKLLSSSDLPRKS